MYELKDMTVTETGIQSPVFLILNSRLNSDYFSSLTLESKAFKIQVIDVNIILFSYPCNFS